jgi:hypothetical protein
MAGWSIIELVFISKPVAKALDTKQRQKKRGRKKIFKTAAFLEKPKVGLQKFIYGIKERIFSKEEL